MSQALTVHETDAEYETAFDTEYDPNYPTVADVMEQTEASPLRTTGRVRYTQAHTERQNAETFCCQFPQDHYVKSSYILNQVMDDDEIKVLQFLIGRYIFAKADRKLGDQGTFLCANQELDKLLNYPRWKRARIITKLKARNLISTQRQKSGGLVHYRLNFELYQQLIEEAQQYFYFKAPKLTK